VYDETYGLSISLMGDVSVSPTHAPGPSRRLKDFDYKRADHAYFVTARARQATAPFSNALLARQVVESIHWLRSHREVKVYAYCLMPDHLHLLLQMGSEEQTLGYIVGSLKHFTTTRSWGLGFKGELWQARFHDHIVRRSEDGEKMATYIVQNPVRKNLVGDASEYAYAGFPDPL
jgi:putative transposase